MVYLKQIDLFLQDFLAIACRTARIATVGAFIGLLMALDDFLMLQTLLVHALQTLFELVHQRSQKVILILELVHVVACVRDRHVVVAYFVLVYRLVVVLLVVRMRIYQVILFKINV